MAGGRVRRMARDEHRVPYELVREEGAAAVGTSVQEYECIWAWGCWWWGRVARAFGMPELVEVTERSQS
jgi:hypothetical protein